MGSAVIHTSVQVNGEHIGAVIYEKQEERYKNPLKSLVLLHGFTGSAENWQPLLDELALPGMRIIALDMPGHGRSSAPADVRRYTMERCCEDILAVLRALGVAPGEAALLGYSMGGRVALYCAFSGFFRAVILESASPGLADAAVRAQRRAADEALAERIEREGVPAFVAYWERMPLFASQQALPEEVRNALRKQRLRNRADGLANSLRGLGTGVQPALHDRLAELHMPVLLITGELDTKFCEIARQMERSLPHAVLCIVPGAGHSVHLEQPAAFATAVKQFLQKG